MPTLFGMRHGKSDRPRTANELYNEYPGNMASGAPVETDSHVRLRTWRRHWLYNPGEKDTAKQVAKRKAQSCTMPKREDGNVGEESAIKKKVKKIFNCFRQGYQSTRFRVFSRYSDPAGRKASGPGKGGTVSVLLLMTELIVIFVFEGCRRDLSGASGQTAL